MVTVWPPTTLTTWDMAGTGRRTFSGRARASLTARDVARNSLLRTRSFRHAMFACVPWCSIVGSKPQGCVGPRFFNYEQSSTTPKQLGERQGPQLSRPKY